MTENKDNPPQNPSNQTQPLAQLSSQTPPEPTLPTIEELYRGRNRQVPSSKGNTRGRKREK